jgi:hypothetical protein
MIRFLLHELCFPEFPPFPFLVFSHGLPSSLAAVADALSGMVKTDMLLPLLSI